MLDGAKGIGWDACCLSLKTEKYTNGNITRGVFWLIVVLCIVWWAFQDHLRGKTTAFSIVGAHNVLDTLILEGS